MSFFPLPPDSVGTGLDPQAYVRVNTPHSWSGYSNTLVVPPGVTCGGGFSSPCDLYLEVDVDGGNSGDPDMFYVAVYKNNVEIDSYEFYPYYDDSITATYIGYSGDSFHLGIGSLWAIPTGGGYGGGTSHPSITAVLGL